MCLFLGVDLRKRKIIDLRGKKAENEVCLKR